MYTHTNKEESERTLLLQLRCYRYCQFANDEMDYGQGLELGQDLFCFGDKKLHGYVGALLPMAYTLLNFQAFSKIIDAHLQKRTADEPCYLK